ncbi:MAG: nucleoside monophosphate kinase [Nanoarchaeota archaeon]|nr:nucleoside monophosphate kinase [Nanoarchaeota archaeon]
MKIVPLGPPGVGKGTLAKKISENFQIPHISTGDIFRRLAEEGDPIGAKARDEYWGHGNLVPDEITNELVRITLAKPEYRENFILDGFPRTRDQAEALDTFVGDYIPLLLTASDQTIRTRILNRLTCSNKDCEGIYNSVTKVPKYARKCDCGSELIRRKDDNKKALPIRMAEYQKNSPGVLAYYGGRVLEIDAEQSSEKIYQEVINLFS